MPRYEFYSSIAKFDAVEPFGGLFYYPFHAATIVSPDPDSDWIGDDL